MTFNKQPILILLFALATMLVMLACLSSCNPVKRVLSDPKKKEIVGREWEKEHPCINQDSLIKYLPGKEYTTYDTVTVNNSTVRIDSFVTNVPIIKYITKTIHSTDTIRVSVEDRRRLQLAYDDINKLKGANDVLTKNVKTETDKKNNWFWLFLGAVMLHVIFLGLKIRKAFSVGSIVK